MPEQKRINPRAFIILAFVVICSVAFHASYGYVLSHGIPGHWSVAAASVIMFCMLFGVATVASIVIDARWIRFSIPAAVAVSGCILGFSWPIIIGVCIEFIAFLAFIKTVHAESQNRIKLSLTQVMAYSSTLGISLILLAVSVIAYQTINNNVASGRFQKSLVSASVTAFNRAAPLAVKGYTPSMTVDEFIRTQMPTPTKLVKDLDLFSFPVTTKSELEKRLGDAGIDPEQLNLDTILNDKRNEEQELIRQVETKFDDLSQSVVDTTRTSLSDTVGVMLRGDERVDQAISDILTARIEKYTIPQLRFIPLILTVTIFLTLMLFTWFFSMLAVALARTLFFIGRHSGFIIEQQQQVTVTRFLLAGDI